MQEAQKNPELQSLITTYNLNSFNVQNCIKDGYCGTFFFDYKSHEFLQLSAMAEFNVKALKKQIEEFIWKECIQEETEEIDIDFGF